MLDFRGLKGQDGKYVLADDFLGPYRFTMWTQELDESEELEVRCV